MSIRTLTILVSLAVLAIVIAIPVSQSQTAPSGGAVLVQCQTHRNTFNPVVTGLQSSGPIDPEIMVGMSCTGAISRLTTTSSVVDFILMPGTYDFSKPAALLSLTNNNSGD